MKSLQTGTCQFTIIETEHVLKEADPISFNYLKQFHLFQHAQLDGKTYTHQMVLAWYRRPEPPAYYKI